MLKSVIKKNSLILEPPKFSSVSTISSTQQAFQEEILPLDPGSLPDKARKEDIAVSTPCNNQTSVANKPLQCKFCNQQYLHRSSLSRHIKTVHSDKTGTIDCELCTER